MRITEYLFDLSENFDETLDKKIDNFLKILDLKHKVDNVWEYMKKSLKYTNQYLEEYEIGFKLHLDDELNLKKEKI